MRPKRLAGALASGPRRAALLAHRASRSRFGCLAEKLQLLARLLAAADQVLPRAPSRAYCVNLGLSLATVTAFCTCCLAFFTRHVGTLVPAAKTVARRCSSTPAQSGVLLQVLQELVAGLEVDHLEHLRVKILIVGVFGNNHPTTGTASREVCPWVQDPRVLHDARHLLLPLFHLGCWSRRGRGSKVRSSKEGGGA